MTGGLTRRAALGLVAGGAVVGGFESGALSQLVADRGVSVGTAADPDALLGLVGVADADTIPTFTNHATHPMVVTVSSGDASVEFDVGNDGSFAADPDPFDLAVGATEEVGVTGDSQTVPVDVLAELRENGQTVGTIELARDFAVSQAGQIEVTPNVKSAGNSGKYEYELQNTGEIDVTIKALSIVETTEPSADEVRNGGILNVDGTSVVSSPISVSDTFVAFDSNVALETSDAKSFEFDRFVDEAGNNAKMKGADVRIRLRFTDDSTLLVDLCLNGCDF